MSTASAVSIATSVPACASASKRVQTRLINAARDTAFRVALDRHRMNVTQTNGLPVGDQWFPVGLVDTDALLIGMSSGRRGAT